MPFSHERRHQPLVRAARQRHAHELDVLRRRHAPAVDERRLARRAPPAASRLRRRRRARAPGRPRCSPSPTRPRRRAPDLAAGRPPILMTRVIRGSPAVSSRPSMRFAFCTAWPAAPFMRLSIARRDEQHRLRACPPAAWRRCARRCDADDVAERRRLRRNLDERLAGVRVAPRRKRIGERLAERHRDRRQNAARDRKQVRREDQIRVRAPRRERRAHLVRDAGACCRCRTRENPQSLRQTAARALVSCPRP